MCDLFARMVCRVKSFIYTPRCYCLSSWR
jgi:hypothetical protein